MFRRVLLSVVAIGFYWAANALYSPVAALKSADIATQQFDNSDFSFVNSFYSLQVVGGVHTLFSLVLLVLLVAIWFKPVRDLVRGMVVPVVLLLAAGTATLQSQDARAFATNGSDRKEFARIEPDETAFLIPNFGANLDTQAQYHPEFLNGPNIKVPGKFIEIPHSKLSGTGGSSGLASMFGSDYYVNTATLIRVKRTQYSRVWTKPGRGTRKDADESFDCQAKDGLNVEKIGIAIIVVIDDQNAALYLSSFGLKPVVGKDDPSNIENVFLSVREARLLTEVTDDVAYTQVHQLVCKYIAKEDDPETASAHMNEIMDNVAKELRTYLAGVGITLKSLGWADTWTFDADVQFAMNQKFNAKMVGASLDILERNAAVNLKEGMAVGFRTRMPQTLFFGAPELLGVAASGAAARSAGSTVGSIAPPAK